MYKRLPNVECRVQQVDFLWLQIKTVSIRVLNEAGRVQL